MKIPSILNKIVDYKKKRLKNLSEDYKKEVMDTVYTIPKKYSFYKTMAKEGLSIIGEIKKGSPSKGIIKEEFEPIKIAKDYEKAVDAISILTEEDFFYGHSDYLKLISTKVNIPILRKDFIIDEFQIYEAKVLGASSILLIATLLDEKKLKKFINIAKKLNIDVLLEVHTNEELKKALNVGADIIGINNRNLHDFSIDLNTTLELSKYIPDDKIIISESGIHTIEHIKIVKSAKVDGILVGESFMRAKNIIKKAEEFKNAVNS